MKEFSRKFYRLTGWTPAGAVIGTLAMIGALVVFLGVMSALLRVFGVG